jgi:ligand-binding sensor domain-containing protein
MSLNSIKSLCLFLLALSSISGSFAQERTLGTWKSFMPYANCQGVFDAGDKVYVIGIKSIFSYEKNTGVIQTYDKATGLSDIGIKTAAYDQASHALVIAYENSNIDIIYNGTDIYNISEIKNQNTVSAVSINGISFYNGDAYISSDIGISVINLSRKEISNTYKIGSNGEQIKVYSTATDGQTIYAATDEGVKYASYNSPNLQNFNNWHVFTQTQGLPEKKATLVSVFNNKAYATIGSGNCDTLFEFSGAMWTKKQFDSDYTFATINVVNGLMYFTTWGNSVTNGKNGKIDLNGQLSFVSTQHPRPLYWFESNGVSWEGDLYAGFIKNTNGNQEYIIPNGPPSTAVFDLDVVDGTLNVAPGGVDDSWGFTWNRDGFYYLKNDQWKVTNQYSLPQMYDYSDLLCTATSTTSNKTYFGSFLSGLIEVNNANGDVKFYDKWTPGGLLEGAQGDTPRTKISAMAADKAGNIWIGNSGATKPIKMIKPDGTWKQFSLPFSFQLMKKMIIDQNGQLWAPLRRSGDGLLVWNNNGTEDDPTDDVSRILTTGSGTGGLPDPTIFCVAEDKDGNIWVGTSQGIGVFYCPGSVLTNNGCDADQIKVERDGYIGYLFGTESVRAIAVDAANRKWIGTTNGLWLISDDGKKELLKFTSANSPLPSNQITDIAIDDKTGEVFIGALGGLVSYQGDAIGECADCTGALVYPNPVKPDYTGPIAIKGLTENAYVKITDISGTLVYQGKANGTQMIWDGKGYNGTRAKTGVYLVFSSTDLGKERKVAKILVAN